MLKQAHTMHHWQAARRSRSQCRGEEHQGPAAEMGRRSRRETCFIPLHYAVKVVYCCELVARPSARNKQLNINTKSLKKRPKRLDGPGCKRLMRMVRVGAAGDQQPKLSRKLAVEDT